MKKLELLFAAMFILSVSNLSAQSWNKLTIGFDSNFYDVTFLNASRGYVCSDNGAVFKTINRGDSWVSVRTEAKEGLACVHFLSENIGFVSSGFYNGYGAIYKTENAGNTWTKLNVPKNCTGGGMWFVNENVGLYTCADSLYGESRILRTSDGGNTWDNVATNIGWISYFSFADSLNGYATVNNGTVLKTSNGGLSWVSLDLGQNLWGSGVCFYTKDVGLVGGQNFSPSTGKATIFKTTNGGNSWTAITTSDMIFKIRYASESVVYALSVNQVGTGKMIKSTDGGSIWSDVTSPGDKIRGIHFVNSSLGYAVGDSGTILKFETTGNVSTLERPLVQLYPNPSNSAITILLESSIKTGKYIILNMEGREVLSGVIDSKITNINTQFLSEGLYIVEVYSNDFIIKEKMIIQR
ncbi:MAG: hypothetical protein RLZZ337_269 [Bacteroidota bacterium]|jgi:photosystem II stability/assembly factor-like uncharacterized protein